MDCCSILTAPKEIYSGLAKSYVVVITWGRLKRAIVPNESDITSNVLIYVVPSTLERPSKGGVLCVDRLNKH